MLSQSVWFFLKKQKLQFGWCFVGKEGKIQGKGAKEAEGSKKMVKSICTPPSKKKLYQEETTW